MSVDIFFETIRSCELGNINIIVLDDVVSIGQDNDCIFIPHDVWDKFVRAIKRKDFHMMKSRLLVGAKEENGGRSITKYDKFENQ